MLVLLLLNLLLLTGCEEIFIILQKVRGLVGCKRLDQGCAIKILEALDWLLSLRLSIVLLVQHSLVRLRLSFIQGILVRANLLVNALMEQLLLALIAPLCQAINLLKMLLLMTLEDLLVWLGLSLVLLEELLLRLLIKLLLLQIQRLNVAEVF